MHRSKGASRGKILTWLFCVALAGCGSPSALQDERLVVRAETITDTIPIAEGPVDDDNSRSAGRDSSRQRIRIGRSERSAVLSSPTLKWMSTVLDGHKAWIEFSVATVGSAGEPRTAWIEMAEGDSWREVYQTVVGSEWQTHRFELGGETQRDVEIAFRSAGPGEVAWAELYVTRARAQATPNLVLVIIDTLRSDHLSCYGYPLMTSPNLDRLASEGLLFVNSFSTSTWTLPSVATLLTGLLPDQHGLKSIDNSLSAKVETVAERLRDAGYRTAAFTDGGFLEPRWGFSQGFDRYDSTAGEAWQPKDVSVIEADASAWLRENRFSPFFLLVHTYETHQPYRFRSGYSEKFLGDEAAPPENDEILAWDLAGKPDDGDFLKRVLALYDGEIARADHHIGRLVETLREIGQYDNTAIVVTSDHGEEFLEHGGVEHGAGKVFNENIRVPLLIKPPAASRAGRVDTPVSGLDIAPTILQIAGLGQTDNQAGRSLLAPALSELVSRNVFAHGLNSFPQLNEERYRLDGGGRAVVFDRVRDRLSFFDLENDPGMRRAMGPTRLPAGDDLVERLQYILAWSSGRARYLVRLPADTTGLALTRESSVTSAVLWEGLTHRMLEIGARHRLSSEFPHAVAFDLEPSADSLRLELMNESTQRWEIHEIAIVGSPQPLAESRPIRRSLPQPLVVGLASRAHEALDLRIDAEAAEELRALGYLQ
jgi:arylsulfatase A-like enzyme